MNTHSFFSYAFLERILRNIHTHTHIHIYINIYTFVHLIFLNGACENVKEKKREKNISYN